MPLVQYPFAAGIKEGTHPSLLALPGLTRARNVAWRRDGAAELRYGFGKIGGSSLIAPGVVAMRDEEVCVLASSGSLYAYSEQQDKWYEQDTVARTRVTRRDVIADASSFLSHDIAYASGLYCVAYVNGMGRIFVVIMDATTHAIVLGPTAFTSAAGGTTSFKHVRLLVVGGYFVVVYSDATIPNIYARRISTTAPTSWSAEVQLDGTPAFGDTTQWMFAAAARSTDFVIAYWTAAASFAVKSFSSALAQTAVITYATGVGAGPYSGIDVCTGGGYTFVTWNTPPAPGPMLQYIAGFDNALLGAVLVSTSMGFVPTAGQIFGRCAIAWGEDRGYVAVSQTDTSGYERAIWYRPFDIGGVLAYVRTQYSASLLAGFGAPRDYATDSFYPRMWGYTVEGTAVLLDPLLDDEATATLICHPCAVAAPRSIALDESTDFMVPRHVAVSASTYVTTMSVAASASGRAGLAIVKTELSGIKGTSAEQARALTLSNGLPVQHDGQRMTEHGYVVGPVIQAVTNTGAGGVDVGAHSWKAVFVWVDARGRYHRSTPSAAAAITIGGAAAAINVQVTCCHITRRDRIRATTYDRQPIFVELYRTLAGGSVFYRASTEPLPVGWLSSITARTITISDSTPDATISANPVLYTQADIPTYVCPPSLVAVCQAKGRLWGIGDDERTVWYSDEDLEPDAPGWHDERTIPFPTRLVAVGELDDKVIVFGEDRIWAVTGDGPGLTLSGAGAFRADLIVPDLGCSEPRSVVRVPQGLAFQSSRGIELLDRSLGVTWIGKDIQSTLATYPLITGAAFIDVDRVCAWSAVASDGSINGTMLVWNVDTMQWATWDVNQGSTCYAYTGMCRDRSGRLVAVGNLSVAVRENRSTWLDPSNVFVPLVIETAPIAEGGPMGQQRVSELQLLAQRYEAHGLTVEIERDHSGTYAAGEAFTFSESDLTTVSDPMWIRMVPATQQCATMRLRITTTTPASLTTGRSCAFIGFAATVDVTGGAYKDVHPTGKK